MNPLVRPDEAYKPPLAVLAPMDARLLGLAAAALLLVSGCTAPAGPDGGQLAMTVIKADPFFPEARLTNHGTGSVTVSYGGFRLVDTTGVVTAPSSRARTEPDAFPSTLRLGPGEAAEGFILFEPAEERPPYTLRYDFAGARAEAPLASPGPESGNDNATEAPAPGARIGEWVNTTALSIRLLRAEGSWSIEYQVHGEKNLTASFVFGETGGAEAHLPRKSWGSLPLVGQNLSVPPDGVVWADVQCEHCARYSVSKTSAEYKWHAAA
jgi:hypothetical protein